MSDGYVSTAEALRQFKSFLEADSGNGKCFDCGSDSPSWCSVSHGVNVCLNCIGIHRGFGVHISFARSATMDDWTENQLQFMRLGGNTKARAFFDKYNISSLPPREKYHSKGAAHYRQVLKAVVDGSEPPAALPIEEGPEQIPVLTRNPPPSAPIMNQPAPQAAVSSGLGGWFSAPSVASPVSLGGFFGSAFSAAKQVTSTVVSTVKEQAAVVEQTSVFQAIKESTNKGYDSIKTETSRLKAQLDQNETFATFTNATSQALESAKRGVNELAQAAGLAPEEDHVDVTDVLPPSGTPPGAVPPVPVIDDAFGQSASYSSFAPVPPPPAAPYQAEKPVVQKVEGSFTRIPVATTAAAAPVVSLMDDDDDDEVVSHPAALGGKISGASDDLLNF